MRSRTDLLDRDSERAALDSLAAAVRRGEGRALVLRGEAGIGKTALLEYLVRTASDLTIVRAVGVESEMELAYASLHQMCAPMLERLPSLPPPQRRALEIVLGLSDGPAPDRFLVGLAVLSLLSDMAEERPLLCLIDDGQWLDKASALTLAFVARRLGAEPVGVVFAARQPGEELQGLSELTVEGLVNGDARALFGSAIRFIVDERVRDRIVAETRGNPLALLELPRGLTATQLASGFGLLDAHTLSGRIEESFVRRLNRLPGDARRLVLVAAAEPVGDPVLVWRAAERLGLRAAPLGITETDGLLSIGDRVMFRHPLVRSAVYGAAPGAERRQVHLALAEVTDPRADPDRRAWHFAAACEEPDEQVAVELERSAGRAQARGGLAAAAAFLRRAVALTGDPSRRVERALSAAEVSVKAGTFDEAEDLLNTADVGSTDELQQARIELLRGQIALFQTTGGGQAPALLVKAAKRLERTDPNLARDAYLDALGAAVLAGSLTADVGRAARSAPRPVGSPRASDVLLDSLATLITDGRAAAAPLLQEATRTFAVEDFGAEASLRWGWLFVLPTYALWDEEGNYAICVRQVELARRVGALGRLPLDLNTFALLAVRCGDLVLAEEAIDEANALSEVTGGGYGPLGATMLAALRGRETEAPALIESATQIAAAAGQGVAVQLVQWMLSVLYNGLGRCEDALHVAESSKDTTDEIFVSAWAAMELLEAATRCDNTRAATLALERITAATAFASADSALGILARSRALVSEGDSAERLYAEAIDRLGRTRLRPELSRTHLLYGEWLRRENRHSDAREQLRTAYDQFTSIGMEAFAERTRMELLATGEKLGQRAVEQRDELTAQERQIARLAREGLSNAQIGAQLFLSPRTVEWHLRKVYTKLGIRSRRELVGRWSVTSKLMST